MRARRGGWLAMLARIARMALLALVAPLVAAPAWGKGWDPPGYTLRMNAFGTSDAFPGSVNSGPDRGLVPAGEVSSGIRLSRALKLGLSASAGGNVQSEFTRANYAWVGLGTLLRHDKTTLTLEGEWTPRRNKFPTDPEEGGEFAGRSLTASLRRNLGVRARLRVDGTLDREKFVPLFTDRDSDGRELFASITVTPARGIDLRADGSISRDDARAAKWDKTQRWAGLGVVWSDSSWRADLSTRSGVRRYTGAILGQSNFLRRDQWIELRLRVSRTLRPGLSTSLGATLADQTSSRADRGFDAHTFTLGFEWTGGGK